MQQSRLLTMSPSEITRDVSLNENSQLLRAALVNITSILIQSLYPVPYSQLRSMSWHCHEIRISPDAHSVLLAPAVCPSLSKQQTAAVHVEHGLLVSPGTLYLKKEKAINTCTVPRHKLADRSSVRQRIRFTLYPHLYLLACVVFPALRHVSQGISMSA